jgi:hypothetical protein
MSQWAPCKRRVFIQRLRKLGFDGPFSGSRHQFMIFKHHRMSIPSNAEYSVPQVKMMVSEIQEIIGRTISAEEWQKL